MKNSMRKENQRPYIIKRGIHRRTKRSLKKGSSKGKIGPYFITSESYTLGEEKSKVPNIVSKGDDTKQTF